MPQTKSASRDGPVSATRRIAAVALSDGHCCEPGVAQTPATSHWKWLHSRESFQRDTPILMVLLALQGPVQPEPQIDENNHVPGMGS